MSLLVVGTLLKEEALWVARKVDALKLRKAVLTQTTDGADVVLEIEIRDLRDQHHGRAIKIPRDQPEAVHRWHVLLLEEVLTYVSVKERQEPGSFRESA
jgi:hypothetical protein